MRLYHGSNMLIEKVELQMCRPYKDFGRGFYCTTIKGQAELMAKRVTTIFGGIPMVTEFELNESIYIEPGMRIKKFESPSKDWALLELCNFSNLWEEFNLNVIKALMEGITQDLIIFIVEDKDVTIEEAMKIVYNSTTFEKLSNSETGLYRESSAYVYDLFKDELEEGCLIQKEF